MSDNQPYEPSQAPSDPNQIDDWRDTRQDAPDDLREVRRDERRDMRAKNYTGAWIWGIFLILLGLGLLADNMGLFSFDNWWALFIMIPAIGSFQSAWNHYRAAGDRLNGEARGSLIGGVILTFIAFIFLFDLSFGLMWPLLLVIAGVGLLINAMMPD